MVMPVHPATRGPSPAAPQRPAEDARATTQASPAPARLLALPILFSELDCSSPSPAHARAVPVCTSGVEPSPLGWLRLARLCIRALGPRRRSVPPPVARLLGPGSRARRAAVRPASAFGAAAAVAAAEVAALLPQTRPGPHQVGAGGQLRALLPPQPPGEGPAGLGSSPRPVGLGPSAGAPPGLGLA